MNLLRSFFGDPAEKLEEKGDTLRLAGQWREATWFYRQALEVSKTGSPRRERLAALEADASGRAFRALLDEAESLARRRLHSEALETLDDAERFASGGEERAILLARRAGLHEAFSGSPEPAPLAPDEAETDSEPGDEVERVFRSRLDGRSAAERRRLLALGPAGRRGFVLLGQGDAPAAMAAFQEEIAGRPQDWVARELMAHALEGLGRLDEARQEYEAAYRRAPDHHVLVLEVSRLLRERLDDPVAALERIDAAVRRHPPSTETLDLYMERVSLLVQQQRLPEAVGGLTELLAEPSLDHGFLRFNRGGLLEQLGRLEEAEADLRAAVEAAPSNVLYLERLADFSFRARRDASGAIASLDRALTIDAHDFAARRGGLGTSPDRARLQYKAARALFVLGRMAEAQARVREGLIVCHDPRVEEALLDLRRDLGSF